MATQQLEQLDRDSLSSDFRIAMRRLASGVGVLTALGPDGPVGMAATSITSLTVDPPAILCCVNRSAGLHAHIHEGSRLCVNLLARHQRDVSVAFGGNVPREIRFTVGTWILDRSGVGWLEDAQANLSCWVEQTIAYHTHSIVMARVDAVHVAPEIAPLIYQNGEYL